MREYIDLIELVDFNPEKQRIEVTGDSPEDRLITQAKMEAIMVGKSYQVIAHTCYHEEKMSCLPVLIKEV